MKAKKPKAIWILASKKTGQAKSFWCNEGNDLDMDLLEKSETLVLYIPAPPAPASRPLSDFGRVKDLREVARLKPGAKIGKGLRRKGKVKNAKRSA